MVNPFRDVNWRPDRAERRRFAVSLMVGFPSLAAALLVATRWQGGGWNFGPPLWLGGVGATLGLIFWLWPWLARPGYVVWYAVACAIGFVVGNGALVAIYFLLLTPVAWVMRALGRRPLGRGLDRGAATYWREAPPPAAPERYYRQF